MQFFVKLCPLRLNFLLSRRLVPGFLLRCRCEGLELVAVELHVRSDHRVRHGCDRLIPVRLLRPSQQTSDDEWIRNGAVLADKLLNGLAVQKNQRPFSSLIVHTFSSGQQTLQQDWTELVELGVRLASQKFQDLFTLVDENHFFRRTGNRPVLEQALN